MQSNAPTPEAYIASLPPDRQSAIIALRHAILQNLPEGFKEQMHYGMLGYVVPHSLYPAGYHVTPTDPLPFMNLASQKNFIAVYHMGLYSDEKLVNWFAEEYAKVCKRKLDMGKGCIRLKKMEEIPVELIGELAGKITLQEWISIYERLKDK
jgi:uncharacterized protein YdhG (YjbR/CyaY superfamily)